MSDEVPVPPHEDDFVPLNTYIRDRILFVMKIYPVISPSMLQVGIGTTFSPKLWRPVFDALVREGRIKVTSTSTLTPTGRAQEMKILTFVPADQAQVQV